MFGKRSKLGSSVKITFQVKKKVEFGRGLYVSGSPHELGSWNIRNSLKLYWSDDNVWVGEVLIERPACSPVIEFKYVIGDYDCFQNQEIEWEAGNHNRKINIFQHSSPTILCQNDWNMERIALNLYVQETKENQYMIIGDSRQLGNWKVPIKIDRQLRKIDKTSKDCSFLSKKGVQAFSTSISVFRGKQNIHYYYIKGNKEIERLPGRRYELSKGKSTHSKCFSIGHKSGETQIYEFCDFKALNYSKVTENIYLGTYVKEIQDFIRLKEEGVHSIFSIQTEEDMSSHQITYDQLEALCQNHGIDLFTYSIQDMNKQDFLQKCLGAMKFLWNVVYKEKKKVYVHCTAGMYRSPQIVALYLALTEGYRIEEAVKLVQQKHTFARPNTSLIKDAMKRINSYFEKNQKVNQKIFC